VAHPSAKEIRVLDPNDRLLPHTERVAAKVIDGEAILIDLCNGRYYNMEGVGAEIWSLIERGCSLAQMVDFVAGNYDVSPEDARADLERLAARLLREELVTISNGAAPPVGGDSGNGEGRRAYLAPELIAHRDMADLLALDPPTPGLQRMVWEDPEPELTS
jgi:hypothetical protein